MNPIWSKRGSGAHRSGCPLALMVAMAAAMEVLCPSARCEPSDETPVLAVITTPLGAGREAEIARSLVPRDLKAPYALKPIRALAGLNRPEEQNPVVERAKALTQRAKEAALAFDLVLAAQLRRQTADELLGNEILALDATSVAVHLLEAGAASVEAGERDMALLYFRKALAVDGDINPGPLISPEAHKVFEAARDQGPSYFSNPNDRTLRRLCAALRIQGILWIAVGKDDEGLVVSEKLLLVRDATSKLDTRHYSPSDSADLEKWIADEKQRLSAVVALGLTEEPEPAEPEDKGPWYKQWWIYAIAGGVIAAGAAGIAIAFALEPEKVDVVVHH